MHRTFASFFFPFNVLASLCRAFLANRQGSNKWLPLPPVAPRVNTSLSMEQLAAGVDRIIGLVIVNTAHPCLYYSYARCRALRIRGYPVQLNIGLHSLQGKREAEGHCWISFEGRPLFEEKDPHEMYPDRMGEHGDVVYWARLKGAEGGEFVRLRKE
ncbi:MAG: lasso peptide biosynthesis protein [Desulfobulbaceae bacterium]|nr:lasso peptide biosynthesis protein [Desulfobulbaceae bacterium]